MGRGTRSSHAASGPFRLREPLTGRLPAWCVPEPRPPRSRAGEEVALAQRGLARAMGDYRKRIKSSSPHPVRIHDDDPVIDAAMRLAVTRAARALYVTPTRATGLLGEPAVAHARQRITDWARRELSAQRPGVGDLTGAGAFEVFALRLADMEDAVALVGADAARDLPACFTAAQWLAFLEASATSEDPRRTLIDVAAATPGI